MSIISASLTPDQLAVGRWVKFYPERSPTDVTYFYVLAQTTNPLYSVCDLLNTNKETWLFRDIPESPSSVFEKHTIEVIPKGNVSKEIDISTVRSVEGIATMCLQITNQFNIDVILLLKAFQKPNCEDALALIRNSCESVDEKALHWVILDLAIQHGQLDIVQKMLSTSTVNIQGTLEQTPLILACRYNQEEIARWLIEKMEANPSIVDYRRDNALHWAAWLGFSDIVQMLLKSSIDPNAPGCAGKTALEQAEKRKHQDVVEILRKPRANL